MFFLKTKKIARRLLVWALTLAMVMSMCSIFVGAADYSFSITATPAEVKAGDTVTVTVKTNEAIGFANCGINVFFDDSSFTWTKYQKGSGLNKAEDKADEEGASLLVTKGLAANGKSYAWAYMSTDYGYDTIGDVFILTFTAKEDIKAGDYKFDLSFSKDKADVDKATVKNLQDKNINVTADTPATVKVAPKTIAVTGVSLDKTALTLTEGESATLAATVAPADAANKAVTWSTSDKNIATVADGKVTAVKPGKATITVKTADGNKTATCAVTVEAKPEIKPTSISIPATAELTIGGKQTLKATVLPENAVGTVTWKSSNDKIAKVSASGEVSAIGIGTAEITASIGEVVSNKCVVTVNGIDLKGIAIDPTEAQINVGGTKKLNVVYDPANTTDDKTVTWSSSDEAVATVANDGTVTAVAEGEATITAKCGEFTATSKITVTKVAVTGIKLDKSTVSVAEGKTVELKATITPDNAANKDINWFTSDPEIATVDENGVVTAVKKGTAIIAAVAVDGELRAECKVSVLTQEEYDEFVETADPAVYAIALIIALMSVVFMGALLVLKRKQSVR